MDLSEMKLEPGSARKWEAFRQQPARAPELRASGRDAFLAQVDAIPQSRLVAARSSRSSKLDSLKTWPRTRRFSPAWTPMVFIMIALALILTAGGALAAAAQDSLPGDPLYSVKMASENFRLTLAVSDASRFRLDLELTDRRVGEISALMQSGQAAPAGVEEMLQAHLHSALRLAAGMDDQAMRQALIQIQQRTLLQLQLIQRVPDQADPLVLRVLAMLQNQLRVVEMGLADPAGFRQRLSFWQPESPIQAPVKPHFDPTSPSTPGSQQPAGKPPAESPQAAPAGRAPGQTPGAQATAQPAGLATGSPKNTQAPGGNTPNQSPSGGLKPGGPGPSDPGGGGQGEPGGTGGGGGKHP